MRLVWVAADTVAVPKGQATPDHTISIMSSGTGFGGFGHRGRTATVASAIEVGRMFLRDIFAAPRIVAEAAAQLVNRSYHSH